MATVASGSWLTRDRVSAFAIMSAIGGAAMLLFLWLARNGTVDWFGTPVGSDFTAFWHGGRLASAGEAVRVWDLAALNVAVESTHGVVFPTDVLRSSSSWSVENFTSGASVGLMQV